MQGIVSRQGCVSGMVDCTMVDQEADLPYDIRTETAPPGPKYLDEVFTPLCQGGAGGMCGRGSGKFPLNPPFIKGEQ